MMNLKRIYWLRIIGALVALSLALAYLSGWELVGLIGFLIIGCYGAWLGIHLRRGTLAAQCDLCGRDGLLKVEYDHGYVNLRLILDCPACGRVVNSAKESGEPGCIPRKEKRKQ